MTTVSSLGVAQQSATPQKVVIAPGPGGHYYSIWWYVYPDYTNVHTNMFCLDHDNGGVCTTTIRGPYGRPYELMAHPNGYIYTGVYNASAASSDLGVFDLSSGAYSFLHAGPSYSTSDGGPEYDGIGNQGMTWSDETNKRIFYYGATRAGMWAWDPVVDPSVAFHDYGILDDPGGAWFQRYGNSFQVSDTHAYCDMRNNSGQHYLVILDINAGTTTTKWKATPKNEIDIYRGQPWVGDGLEILVHVDGSDWYNVKDLDTIIQYQDTYPNPGQRSTLAWTGYYFNDVYAYPDGSGGKAVSCGWTNLSNYGGDPNNLNYQHVSHDILDIANYAVDGAGVDSDNNIITFSEYYGSAVKLDTSTGQFSSLGKIGFSGYSVCKDESNSRIYFGGYPNNACEYNPASSWVIGTNPVNITVQLSAIGARYYYNCFIDSNGIVWYAVNMVRTAQESYLVWYNPSDLSTGDTWDVQLYVNPQPMYYSNMRNTAMNLARNRLVWSGIDKNYGYYSLAVFNTSTKSLVTYYQSLIAGGDCGYVVSVEDGRAGTTNHFVGITEGANCKSYCVDISTGSLVWGPITNTGYTSSFLFANGPTFKGGYVWFYANSQLYKMDPANGDLTLAVDSSATPDGTHFYAFNGDDGPAHHIWIGNSMYHWDTTTATNGKQVYKITGLVSDELYSRYQYDDLPADDAILETIYTSQDITDVAMDDGDRVAQTAYSEYAIHEFKNNATGKTSANFTWNGQSNIPCSTSGVYLQIYNQTSQLWETIDSNTTLETANTDFTLSASVANLVNYKDVDDMISCRVYQLAQ